MVMPLLMLYDWMSLWEDPVCEMVSEFGQAEMGIGKKDFRGRKDAGGLRRSFDVGSELEAGMLLMNAL